MAWQGSTRRSRLPRDWPKRREAVKRRARGQCEAPTHDPDCDGIGSQCDHVIAGDDHSLGNLQWLSKPCHQAKTQAEALQGTRTRKAALKLPPEAHPAWPGAPPAPRLRDRGR